jgi:Tfp pilus assembly protein PilE
MRTVPRAFTISEVIITALVALILTAMAIPQFSTGASAGTDGLAQISVSQAAAAETNYFTGAQAYTSSLTDLTNIDSSISYVASPTPSSSTTVVSVDLASATVVGLAALGANDTCWLERLSLNLRVQTTDPYSTDPSQQT